MFITLYAVATGLVVLGILWAEARCSDHRYPGNALTWAQDAYDEWAYHHLYRPTAD